MVDNIMIALTVGMVLLMFVIVSTSQCAPT
jgi:hypothetical protein